MRSPAAMGCVCFLLLITTPSLALAFGAGIIENQGQVTGPVLFYGECSGAMIYFTEKAIVVELRETVAMESAADIVDNVLDVPRETDSPPRRRVCAVYIYFDGATPPTSVEGRRELETVHSFFLGENPLEWRAGVPEFSQVVYSDPWPGLDLIYRKEGDRLTCEAVEKTEGSSAQIGFSCAGADSVIEEENGTLRIETELGTFSVTRPLVGTSRDFFLPLPRQAPRPGGKGAREAANPGALLWSTYLGSPADENVTGLSLDAAGNPLITGWIAPADFPGRAGMREDSAPTFRDVFVAKLSPSGDALLWCARLGGGGWDEGAALALDRLGNALVTGFTKSGDFPSTPGVYDETNEAEGRSSAFLSKISSDGRSLLWSTLLHGNGHDSASDLCLDPVGDAILVGTTGSADFPTTRGARCSTHAGATDVFVARLSPSGSDLLWSTLIGGGDCDAADALALDGEGNVILTGFTASGDFPATPGAYQESYNGGGSDAFVAKLSASGSSLLWSTFLGGRDGDDHGKSVCVDASGKLVLAGATESSDFPTTPGADDRSLDGGTDLFVAELSPSGDALLWSTFLGGTGPEWWGTIAIDEAGKVFVSGYTGSPDFPTTAGSYDPDPNGRSDAFLTELAPGGDAILWSTFLGGSGYEEHDRSGRRSCAVGLDPYGVPVLCGITRSLDFPTTTGTLDDSHSGGHDLFVAKLQTGSAPTAVYGVQGFEAVARDGGIEVGWDVTSRHTCIGFHILRSEGGGPFTTVTGRMIPNEAPYYPKRFSWIDGSATPGVSYSYKIELFYADGSSEVWDRGAVAELPQQARFTMSLRGEQPVRLARRTEIVYTVPAPGAAVSIALYDIAGRRVAALADGHAGAGTHTLPLSSPELERIGSGVFFLRMDAGGFQETQRIVLLR